MTADTLHILVSAAIWRAEQLEEQCLNAAITAWAEVSQLEEQLANTLPLSQPEGRIARRGAVRAALKARDYTRAEALVERFTGEARVPRALRAALCQMLEEDADALKSRFQHAANHLTDARRQVVRLRERGPFGLAAGA